MKVIFEASKQKLFHFPFVLSFGRMEKITTYFYPV